ncbi:MAG: hypothetical protein RIC49_11360 [Phycisphaerales bacterium]
MQSLPICIAALFAPAAALAGQWECSGVDNLSYTLDDVTGSVTLNGGLFPLRLSVGDTGYHVEEPTDDSILLSAVREQHAELENGQTIQGSKTWGFRDRFILRRAADGTTALLVAIDSFGDDGKRLTLSDEEWQTLAPSGQYPGVWLHPCKKRGN